MSAPIPVFDLRIEQEDLDAVAETLRSGWWTMGERTARFEEEFAEHLGCRHVVALSSCTAALHLALLGAGIGPGDEVIVPAFTFVATAAAVLHCGATPVFADIVGLDDPGIDPEEVELRIGERTKAVIGVHYSGYATALDRLVELCRARGLTLIEDAAHGPGASHASRSLGTFGLAGAFSFFSNKVLSVGEGGALATDDDDVAARARLLRSQGMTAGTTERHTGKAITYDVIARGFNYRIDEPRAALLQSRLPRLAADIDRRRDLVRRYRRLLDRIDGLILPYEDEQVAESSCYMMPVMVRDAERRDAVRRSLSEAGIQTTVMYPGVHEFSAYRERSGETSLPRTELASRSQITLPLFPHLTSTDQDRVVAAVAAALER
jgi:dTDP-4-amino-4,6-dideoxygalactose transaminase